MRQAFIASSIVAAGLLGMAALAQAQSQAPGDNARSEDNTRAVRIIEGTAPGSTTSIQPAAPEAPAVTAPPMGNIDIRQISIKCDNAAGLDLAILPDVELATGSRVTLRIATKKQGYLVLVDIDPAGKLTQIYPNRHSLQTQEAREALNLIKPGQAVTIPNRDNPFAGFEFVAAPPTGVAMIVAILSDRPVHLIDLPDVAPPQTGQAAFDQLADVARQLRIASENDPGTLQEPKWSFDAKLYVVK
jgi:Domain of unknown function (DUF4384)